MHGLTLLTPLHVTVLAAWGAASIAAVARETWWMLRAPRGSCGRAHLDEHPFANRARLLTAAFLAPWPVLAAKGR